MLAVIENPKQLERVISEHNETVQALWTAQSRIRALEDERERAGVVVMGVGDGSGDGSDGKFIHGTYESITIVRKRFEENDIMRKALERIAVKASFMYETGTAKDGWELAAQFARNALQAVKE